MKRKILAMTLMLCTLLFTACGTVNLWQNIDGDTRVYKVNTYNDDATETYLFVNKDGTCRFSSADSDWQNFTLGELEAEYRSNTVFCGTYKLKGNRLCIDINDEIRTKWDVKGDNAEDLKAEYIKDNPNQIGIFDQKGIYQSIAEWKSSYMELVVRGDECNPLKTKVTYDENSAGCTFTVNYRYTTDGRILRITKLTDNVITSEIGYEYNSNKKLLKVSKTANGSIYWETLYTYNADDSYTVTEKEDSHIMNETKYSAENKPKQIKKYQKYEKHVDNELTEVGIGLYYLCEYDTECNVTKEITYEASEGKVKTEYVRKADGSFKYTSYDYTTHIDDVTGELINDTAKTVREFDCNDILVSGSEYINGEIYQTATYFHVDNGEYVVTVRNDAGHIIDKFRITVNIDDFKPNAN